MAKTNGPRIRLELSCAECQYEHCERYVAQGDSGWDRYCGHPAANGRHISSFSSRTPDWCPLRAARLGEFLREQMNQSQEERP